MTKSTSSTTQASQSQDSESKQEQLNKTRQPVKPRQLNKLQTWLIVTIIVLLLIILAEMGYIIYQDKQFGQQAPTPATVTTQVEPTALPTTPPTSESRIEKVIAEVSQEFQTVTTDYDAEMADSKPQQVKWIAPDDLKIAVPDISGVSLNVFNCMEDLETKSLFKQIAGKLGPEIDQIMDSNGFSVNQKNSSQSLTDDRFYDYQQAYESEAVKCLFVANPDCFGSGDQNEMHYYYYSFACSDTFEDSYAQQAPYLKGLGIEQFYTINIEKEIGDFVELGLRARRGGTHMIAKLIDGQWTELYSGQDVPPCTLVEEHNIPEDIAPDCMPE